MSSFVVSANQVPGNIICNLEGVKALALEKVALCKGVIVTEDTTKEAKIDIADFRKMQKDIETARKQIKNDFMKPYMNFEGECKEIVALLEEPIQLMESQVKDFEQQKKDEKKAKAVQLYEELTKDYIEYLPLAKYYKAQWENVSTSTKSVEKDITELVDQVSMAVSAVKATESEFVDKGLESLKLTLDVSKAINTIKGYEAQKREILEREERRKKEEEERRQRAEEARIKAEEAAKVKAEEEARKQAEYEKQIELEAEGEAKKIAEEVLISESEEEPFIIPDADFCDDEEPFIQAPRFIKKMYIIEETELTHSEIEEELTRMGVAFESEEM